MAFNNKNRGRIFDIGTSHEQQEVAAGQLSVEVQRILKLALRSRSDISTADLAELVGVNEKRVSQIFDLDEDDAANVEGNLYTVTLARYLRALGYKLELVVEAVDPMANADKVNWEPPRRSLKEIPTSQRAAYLKTVPGFVHAALQELPDKRTMPLVDYLTLMAKHGKSAREAIEFLSNESLHGRIVIHRDSSISTISRSHKPPEG